MSTTELTETKIPLTAAQRRGQELLDGVVPDWRTRIVSDDLDLSDCGYCILGQVFGSYSDGLTALGIGGDNSQGMAAYFGFEVSTEQVNRLARPYARLTSLWRRAIRGK
jgi:hypothetical protein